MRKTIILMFFFVGLLMITTLTASAANIKDGLLLYFTFDKASGDQVTDMSGNKHDGTLKAGAKIVTDIKKYGTGAIRIEGATQQMEVTTFKELEEYEDHTFLFWIYFTAPPSGGWDSIFAKPAPGSDRAPGAWATAQGTLAIHWRYNPGNVGFQALGPNGDGSSFDKETWYHVAGVKKGTDLTAYIDGQNVGKATVPAAITQGPYSLYIGQSPAYGGVAAKFIMDDFFGYNRALTEAEVNTLMTKGAQAFPVEPKEKLTSTWGSVKEGN